MGLLTPRVRPVHLGDVGRVEHGREGANRAQVGADPLDGRLIEDPGPAGGDEGHVEPVLARRIDMAHLGEPVEELLVRLADTAE